MSYQCDKCNDIADYFLCPDCVTEQETQAKDEGLEEGRKETEENL